MGRPKYKYDGKRRIQSLIGEQKARNIGLKQTCLVCRTSFFNDDTCKKVYLHSRNDICYVALVCPGCGHMALIDGLYSRIPHDE